MTDATPDSTSPRRGRSRCAALLFVLTTAAFRLGGEWVVREDAAILDRLTLAHEPPP